MNTKRRADCQLRNDWKERIIRIGDEQTSLQNQFDNFRNDFSYYPPKIEALEADVNSLNGRVIIAESDIAEAEDRISACETDIDRIDAELVDKTGDINALANRMSLAEADIDYIDARLDGIETGEILLSQLNVDADKDMEGKTLNNVKIGANEVKILGANIDRTRQNEILLYDMQTEIESGMLNIINPNYTILTETDLTAPYSKVVETDNAFGSHFLAWGEYIPVTPGERITIEAWIKPLILNDGYGHISLRIGRYDKDKKPIGENSGRGYGLFNYTGMELNKWHKLVHSEIIPFEHTPYNGSDGGPVRYIRVLYGVNGVSSKPNNDTVRICGIKYYRDAKYITDIQGKVATFDGVVIADGGTVDGVDVSTHTHDGSAVGGKKINLWDVEVTGDKDFASKRLNNVSEVESTGAYPFKMYRAGYKGWAFHKPNNNSLILAPSATVEDPESKDWSNQITFTDDSGIICKTLDGVDVSEHVHDGTAIGGKKISYNNLVDKPTIPTSLSQLATDDENQRVSISKIAEWDGKARPPVPFVKGVNISELTSDEYVMLDVLPPGRSSIILTHIRVATFSTSGGGWIKPFFVADDNTEAGMLTTIDNVGDKALDALRSNTDLSTKNAIKNIKFTVVGGGPITASLTCYGYIY